MVIYLFRDEADNEKFALSVDVTGENIPPITPHSEWIFVEAIDTLKFAEPWDIGDFSQALDGLRPMAITCSSARSLRLRLRLQIVITCRTANRGRTLRVAACGLRCEPSQLSRRPHTPCQS